MNKVIVTAILLFFFTGLSFGQGWERVLSGGGQDEARAIANTPDGGYIIAGDYFGTKAALYKTDADGELQWFKTFLPGSGLYLANAVGVSADSGIVVVGRCRTNQGGSTDDDVWAMKVDFFGNLIWQTSVQKVGIDNGTGLSILPDGSILIAGFQEIGSMNQDAFLSKLTPEGTLVWEKTYGQPNTDERIQDLAVSTDGSIYLSGEIEIGPDLDVAVFKVDPDGNLVWENAFGFDFVPNSFAPDAGFGIEMNFNGNPIIVGKTTTQGGSEASALIMEVLSDGSGINWFRTFPKVSTFHDIASNGEKGFVVSGIKGVTPTNEDVYLVQVDGNGNTLCENRIGKNWGETGNGVVRATDGGIVVAGSTVTDPSAAETYVYLVKTTANCSVYTTYVEGTVYHDFNQNCQFDGNEPGFEDWVVKISSPDFTRYASADENGFFRTLVDTGNYTVSVIPPNNYWSPCAASTPVAVANFYDTLKVDLGIHAGQACPNNTVEIKTPILRRCAENVYTVRYCNNGTMPSIDTKVEVELDGFLKVTGTSIPVQNQTGNTYTFNVGFLDAGDCNSFTITAWLNCDTTVNGQAHCVRAHIFPDQICSPSPNWDGSVVEAFAKCQNDNVQLGVRNAGQNGNLGNTLEYIVVEDEVMKTAPATVPSLNPGEEQVVFAIAATGKTYRIIAQQAPGYPGNSYPTAAVEGCKTDTTTSISYGFFTMFPEDDGNVFVSTDCQESYPADFNPTFLKRGHPKGYDAQHYVDTTTSLDFLIRFSNTGTSAVQQVIVRDTLSPSLDPATVIPGAASHDYDFRVYHDGVVEFTLSNLNLPPGSGAGNAASSGYVQFRVSQKPNLPCPTEIFNRAAVWFDFNEPSFTNETFNTVCPTKEVISVKTNEVYLPGADVRVYPNPFSESAFFEVKGVEAKAFSLELYDLQGKKLIHQFFNQPTFRLFRHALPAGTLIYRLAADGRPVASGKIESLAH